MKLNRWFLPPVLALVFGLLLTGTVMAVLDLEEPVGASQTIWVTEHKENVSPSPQEKVDEALAEYAVKHGVSIARKRNDRSRIFRNRTLYITESPTGPRVPRTTFHPSVEQHVAGFPKDTTNEVRAFYYIFGDDYHGLINLFNSHGYVAQSFPSVLSWSSLLYAFSGYIAPSAALIILLLTALTLSLSLQSARQFAVARLNGHSRLRITIATITQGAPPGAITGSIVIAATLAALKLINDWNELSRFLLLATAVTGTLLTITTFTLFIGIHLATARSIRNNLAGRTDTLPALISLAIVNIVTAVTVVSVLITLVLLSSKVQRFSQKIDPNVQGITYIMLSGSTNSEKNSGEVNAALGTQLRKSNSDGKILLSREIESNSQPQDLPGGPASILLVNTTYLKTHPELMSLTGANTSTRNLINVYIPENRRNHENSISKEIENFFTPETEDSPALPPIRTHLVPSATWPLINDVHGLNTKTSVQDPIVVLVSDDLRPISDTDLAAAITKSQVVFTSRTAAEKAVSDGNLTTYVYSLVDADLARSEAYEKAAQDLAQQTVTFILGIIILIISSTALAALWVQSRRQRLFAEWVTGHSWLRRHSIAVFGYTLLTIATVTTWSIFITPSTSESLPPGEDDRLALLGWAGTLGCAIAITVFITSLAITTARTDHRQEGHA